MNSLVDLLRHPPAATGYCVAYSGGLDSTVLLHLARAAGLPGLRALHVHHGLQASADDWAARCAAQCADWQLPLTVLRVQVPTDHLQGPEAAARTARYTALQAALPPGALLLTAHHAGDQAETVLLRLLRGTGVEGLAAMPMQTVLESGLPLWRPLLKTPRAALQAYAQAQSLHWVDDPHNADPRYTRSWLRTQLMPLLHTRWPDADRQLGRAAAHAADASLLLGRLAVARLAAVRGAEGGLSVSGLLALDAPERRLVLRHWFAEMGLPVPAAETLQRLHVEVLCAAPDAAPLLRWPGAECRRYRDTLHAGAPLAASPTGLVLDWDGRAPLQLPAHLGVLTCDTPQPMQVRFDVPGLRIRPAGWAHHRTLKQLGQEAGIPPWWRSRLPIIFVNHTVASVAGRWNTETAPALHWQRTICWGLPSDWVQ